MLIGYNNVRNQYELLFDRPNTQPEFRDKLLTLPPNKKVLRWEDGQSSVIGKIKFDPVFTQQFIDFCHSAGVTACTLKAKFFDHAGSIEAYEQLTNAGIEVLYIESSNEPYVAPNNRAKNLGEWVLFILNKTEFYKLKANQYANQTRQLLNAFEAAGHDIKHKFAFASPNPVYHRGRTWYNTLKGKLSDIPYIILHLYGNPDQSNWLEKQEEGIDYIGDDFKKICTEYNAIHFGRNGNTNWPHLAFTPEHKQWHEDLTKLMERKGFELAMFHAGMMFTEDRLFHRWPINRNTGELKDRCPDWYGIN